MLAEFKRDSARKELERIIEEIDCRREEMEMMEVPEEGEEDTDLDKSFSKQEVDAFKCHLIVNRC